MAGHGPSRSVGHGSGMDDARPAMVMVMVMVSRGASLLTLESRVEGGVSQHDKFPLSAGEGSGPVDFLPWPRVPHLDTGTQKKKEA